MFMRYVYTTAQDLEARSVYSGCGGISPKVKNFQTPGR